MDQGPGLVGLLGVVLLLLNAIIWKETWLYIVGGVLAGVGVAWSIWNEYSNIKDTIIREQRTIIREQRTEFNYK